MSDKYGECYCGDCISFNKCKSDKGTRINLVSEGCSCFEPNDIAEFDYPILPKWLAEHDKQIREDERRKFIEWIAEFIKFDCFYCLLNDDCTLNDTPCTELILAEYEKEQKNE